MITNIAVSIRPMRVEDIPQVVNIDTQSFSIPWPPSAYEYEFKRNNQSLLFIAELEDEKGENQVVGVIVTWLIVDEAHIATLAVHPEYRNQGIARRLIHHALHEAYNKGMIKATLEVRANNHTAQALYRHFGFQVVGRRLKYYRDNNEDALIMTIDSLAESFSLSIKNTSSSLQA